MEKNLGDQFIFRTKEKKIRFHLIERRNLLRSIKETLNCAVVYKDALMYIKNISENNGENKEINKEVAAIYRGRTPHRGSIRRGKGTYNNYYTKPRQYGNSRDTEGKPKCFSCGKYDRIARACKSKYTDQISRSRVKYSTSRECSQSKSPTRNKRASTPYNKRS